MTARKMFKELGYWKIHDKSINADIIYEHQESGKTILFNNKLKCFMANNEHELEWITAEELKAINKQVEELGWLESEEK